MFLINIIGFILVLGLVIFIHELGHFIMAKRAGILCHEFAIGMGPIVFSRKKGETLYSLRAIPIGGFVMMAGEDVTTEMIEEGQEIKVVRNKIGKITEIILDAEDERYPDAEKITVESYDLQGKYQAPLLINDYEVHRRAHFVHKQKRLQVAPFNRSFESKSLGARFSAIVAGPVMNFVLAFILFLLVAFFVGFPVRDSEGAVIPEVGVVEENSPAEGRLEAGDELIKVVNIDNGVVDGSWHAFQEMISDNKGQREFEVLIDRDGEEMFVTLTPRLQINSVGITSTMDPDDDVVVGDVLRDSPAAQAGVQSGDVILSVGGEEIDDWSDAIAVFDEQLGDDVALTVLRDGQEESLEISPYPRELIESQIGETASTYFGIGPVREFAFLDSFRDAGANVAASSTMIFDTLRMLFGGTVQVGQLSGPVGIYAITTTALQDGILTLVTWVALLSVNLGILNLLPIPALDGGRILFLAYEGVTRRKPNKTVEQYLTFVMFVLLLGLILYVTYTDILSLLGL